MIGRPEQSLHIAVAKYLEAALPPNVPFTTIGHGGGGMRRGKILKAMGVKPGWPDIVLLLPPEGRFFGIELKAEKGRISPQQVVVHECIRAAGGFVFVARSLAEVEGLLRGAGLDLRAHVMGDHGWRRVA